MKMMMIFKKEMLNNNQREVMMIAMILEAIQERKNEVNNIKLR